MTARSQLLHHLILNSGELIVQRDALQDHSLSFPFDPRKSGMGSLKERATVDAG